MTYTPPEPNHSALVFVAHGSNQSPLESYFTEAQLRSEVERVRRETIEECAKVCEEHLQFPSLTPKHCAEAIRGLLK